jgi:hypothetical protein
MTSRSAQQPPASDPLESDALEPPDERPVSADDQRTRETSGHERPAYEKSHERPEHDLRSSLERMLPELIRRGFEVSRGPLEKVSESLFPRDIAALLSGQLGDIRSTVVKAVAHEVGRFLREADIATELRKVLTGLDIDAHVRLRFKAREDGSLEPKVDISLGGSDEERATKKARGVRQG